MAEIHPIEILRAEVRELKVALDKEIAELKRKRLDDVVGQLDLKTEISKVRDEIRWVDEKLKSVSQGHGSRLRELLERVSSLEDHVFSKLGSPDEVSRIIGSPNCAAPPQLDRPKSPPRRK